MKRKQCEITKRKTIEAILGRCTIGRMATIGKDGYPYITPVNYVYLNDTIYFHCASTGEKLENINRDSRVCFEVDIPLAYLDLDYYGELPEACMVHQFYHSVIMRGKAERVTSLEEKLRALNGLVKSHEPAGREFIPIASDTPAVKLCEVVAVRIESITGKSDLAQKKKPEEKKKLATYLLNRNLPGDTEAAHLILDDTH